MGNRDLSRRQWLLMWRGAPEPPRRAPAKPPPPPPPPQPPPPAPRVGLPPLRPPGAIDEAAFADTCHRCGHCVAACPVSAIHPLGDGTPAIDARQAPCTVCNDLACTHACPSGALMPLTDASAIRMGTATLEPTWCLAHRGQPCRACVDMCPVPGALALAKGAAVYVPVVDALRCVGCGMCEKHCPTRPAAIQVIPRAAAEPRAAELPPSAASRHGPEGREDP